MRRHMVRGQRDADMSPARRRKSDAVDATHSPAWTGALHAAAAAALRFGDGGAYPETHVEQHPLGVGVGVAQVHQLRLQAGRLLLADVEGASRGSTPEHVSLRAFLIKHGAEPLGAFPGAVRVERGQCVSAGAPAPCPS